MSLNHHVVFNALQRTAIAAHMHEQATDHCRDMPLTETGRVTQMFTIDKQI